MSKQILVAAVALEDDQGRILIQQRPSGKIASGLWEFPGGKLEPGEAAADCARRELMEELGVEIGPLEFLIEIPWVYSERSVRVTVFRCKHWSGHPQALEEQKFAWVAKADLLNYSLLEANRGIVTALRLPEYFAISAAPNGPGWGIDIENTISSLRDAAFRFRAAGFSRAEYQARIPQIAKLCRQNRVSLVLDSVASSSVAIENLQASVLALHFSSTSVHQLPQTQKAGSILFGVSCHNSEEMNAAIKLGADYILLSPVLPTRSHDARESLGWEQFKRWVGDCPIPVYALGGLQKSDLTKAKKSGAQGVAGISAFLGG